MLVSFSSIFLPQELARAWLAERWSFFERDQPQWFTLAWRQELQRINSHLLPAEATANNEHERLTATCMLFQLLLLPPIAVPTAQLEELVSAAEQVGIDADVLERSRNPLNAAVKKQDIVRSGNACDFWLLSAAHILAHPKMSSLPSWQEIRRDMPEWLKLRTLTLHDAVAGGLHDSILAVSHRWEHPAAPDTKGVQLEALRAYLKEHPNIKWVFFDYSSLPQGALSQLIRSTPTAMLTLLHRSTADRQEDGKREAAVQAHVAQHRHHVFGCVRALACRPLLYPSRFWTQVRVPAARF
jgi:hypothetical protein